MDINDDNNETKMKIKNQENEEKCYILYGIILIEMEQYDS